MSRPGRIAPPNTNDVYAPPDELRLRSIPGNHGHETDPFGTALYEISRRSQEAIVLSATGRELDADLTVTAGHKHDDVDGRIQWMQLGAWSCGEDGDNGCREASYINNTAVADLMLIPLRLPLAGAIPVNTKLQTRFRISNPAPGYVTYTTLYLTGVFYREDFSAALASPLLALSVQSVAARVYANEWVNGPLLTFAVADIVAASGNLCLVLSGRIETAGDKAALLEMQGAWL